MAKPTKKQIEEFLRDKFPHIEFDGIKIVESRDGRIHFKVFSFGRMIGQADYSYTDKHQSYFDGVYAHLKWMWG